MHLEKSKDITIAITDYWPSCIGQETAKEPCGLGVKLPPADMSFTHKGGFTLSLFIANAKQGSCEDQFLVADTSISDALSTRPPIGYSGFSSYYCSIFLSTFLF